MAERSDGSITFGSYDNDGDIPPNVTETKWKNGGFEGSDVRKV